MANSSILLKTNENSNKIINIIFVSHIFTLKTLCLTFALTYPSTTATSGSRTMRESEVSIHRRTNLSFPSFQGFKEDHRERYEFDIELYYSLKEREAAEQVPNKRIP